MYSKLDQMRDQFRQRLNLRPANETKVHVIAVESRDNNNNISSRAKTDSYLPKNPIPRRDVTQSSLFESQKSYNNPSKVTSNLYDFKSKTSPKSDSLDFNKKYDSNAIPLTKTSHLKSDYNNKERKSDQKSLSNRFSGNSNDSQRYVGNESTEGMACRYCRRRFALTERLEKHESVCMSALDKSRIKFNSFEQRVKGQPNDYLLIYENALKNEPKERPKKSNWRQKHEYCIAAIKTAKGEGDSITGPTASEILASIQQQCDYCKRRFNEEAIQRHLPICAKLHHKKLLKI